MIGSPAIIDAAGYRLTATVRRDVVRRRAPLAREIMSGFNSVSSLYRVEQWDKASSF